MRNKIRELKMGVNGFRLKLCDNGAHKATTAVPQIRLVRNEQTGPNYLSQRLLGRILEIGEKLTNS